MPVTTKPRCNPAHVERVIQRGRRKTTTEQERQVNLAALLGESD
jgi:hypothetical protein